MKRKQLYESPLTEEFEVIPEGSCLQTTSDITVTNPDPMPWDNGDED